LNKEGTGISLSRKAYVSTITGKNNVFLHGKVMQGQDAFKTADEFY
jgi:hypothetical protein